MKAQDLMIGATYESVKFGTPVTLTAEDIHEMVCRADGAKVDHVEIDQIVKPIPLLRIVTGKPFRECPRL